MDDLKEQQKIWYKKLKDLGFDEIEHFDPRSGNFNGYMKRECTSLGNSFSELSESYYISARRYLHIGTFESPTEKAVWGHHSEGLSYDKILKHFPSWSSRSPVQRIIRKHKKLMWDLKDDKYE